MKLAQFHLKFQIGSPSTEKIFFRPGSDQEVEGPDRLGGSCHLCLFGFYLGVDFLTFLYFDYAKSNKCNFDKT